MAGADLVGIGFPVAWFGPVVVVPSFRLALVLLFRGLPVVWVVVPRHRAAASARRVGVLFAGPRLGSPDSLAVTGAGLLAAGPFGAPVDVVVWCGSRRVIPMRRPVGTHGQVPAAARRLSKTSAH